MNRPLVLREYFRPNQSAALFIKGKPF